MPLTQDAKLFIYRYSKRRLWGFFALCIFVGTYNPLLGIALFSGVPFGILAFGLWQSIKLGQNKLLLVFAVIAAYAFVLPRLFGALTEAFDNRVGDGAIDGVVLTGFNALGFIMILGLGFGNLRPSDLYPFHRNSENEGG